MFERVANWLIKDVCPGADDPVCPGADDPNSEVVDVLHKYIKLMGRVLVALTAVALFFVLITAVVLFPELPKSKHLAINLQLDGQTLSGYVGVVLGTVVALAGSLLAIILAQRAISLQKTQGDQIVVQNKLMMLEQEREYTILYDHKLGEYQKLMLELSGLLGSCLAVAGELRKKSRIEAVLVAAKSYKKRKNINSVLASLHGLSITPSHSELLLKKYGVEINYLSSQIEVLRLKIMEVTSNQTARRFFADTLLQSAPRFINSAYFASSEKVIAERTSVAILMADLLLKNDGGREVDQDLCFLLMLLSPVETQEDFLFLKDLVDSFPSGVEQVIAGFEKEHKANANRELDSNPLFNGLEKAAQMSNLQRSFVFSDDVLGGLKRISEAFSRSLDKVEKIFSGKLDAEEVRGFVRSVYYGVIVDDCEKIKVLNDEIESIDDLDLRVDNANSILNIYRLHVDLYDLVFDDQKEIVDKSLLAATNIFKLVSNFFALDLSPVQGGHNMHAKAFKLITAAFDSCDFWHEKNSDYLPIIYDFYLRGLAAPNESSFSVADRIVSIDDWINTGFLATPAYMTSDNGIRLVLDRLSWLDNFDATNSETFDLLEKIEELLYFVKTKDIDSNEYERNEIIDALERKIKLIKSKLSKVRPIA